MTRLAIVCAVFFSPIVVLGQDSWIPWCEHPNPNEDPKDPNDDFICHWYRLVEQEETWEQANASSGSRGGYLVTIMNADENAWLITQFASATSSNNALWTGFYQDTTDPDYSEPDHGWKWIGNPDLCRWVTGNPDVCYTNWRAGEPNDSPVGDPVQHQNCSQWYTSQNGPSFAGTWDDQYCDRPFDFELKSIIERDTLDGKIPAVSTWGMAAMLLLLLAAGTIVVMKRRADVPT